MPLADVPGKAPDLSGVEATLAGLLRDLHGLLAKLGPQAQFSRVKRIGDRFTRPGESSDWSSAAGAGSGCGLLTTELVGLSLSKATVRVSYLAPETACLKMRKAWMEPPLRPTIQPSGAGQRKTREHGLLTSMFMDFRGTGKTRDLVDPS